MMKIAIAGYGLEGKVSYDYWDTPDNTVTIVDERDKVENLPEDAPTILSKGAFSKLRDFDMVVRTASLNPNRITTNGKIWSATNEFFEKCPATIIGVTGTKGKGTTSSLITSILQAAGKTVHLVGNIGMPALKELTKIRPDDIVVYELSSFQLWDIKQSPHIAVVLMIEADHLDVHASLQDYIDAKTNIVRYQSSGDLTVYYAENEFSNKIASYTSASLQPYPSRKAVHVRDGDFYYHEAKICSVDLLQIPGEHNISNACAAIAACWEFTQDGITIGQGLRQFTGLPHRLKFVREKEGVKFYDDSIATTPGSVIAAIHAFASPKVLLIGGREKGSDYTKMIHEIKSSDTIRAVICYGENKTKMYKLLDSDEKKFKLVQSEQNNMSQIVAAAFEQSYEGDVVLLSPAAASFDMFTSYADRGQQFISAAKNL